MIARSRILAFGYRAVAALVIVIGIARVSGLWTASPNWLTDDLVHIVTPILVIIDWALFVPKGHLRRHDPLLWALIPFGYVAFAYTYSAVGGRFAGGTSVPYPFMNVAKHGVGGVALWIGGLTVGLVAVGYVVVGCDRLLARKLTSPRASRDPRPTDDPAPGS